MRRKEITFISVEVLWKRLSDMENERRFNGSSYPSIMCPFPFRLTGQGFFPGGDGLWREEDQLQRPNPGLISRGTIMFVGNDFGALDSFRKLKTAGYENVPTWKHLKARVRLVHERMLIDLRQQSFFTNAFLGLRSDGKKALEPNDWKLMPDFCDFCGEFLKFQIETLGPKVIVLMGPKAQDAFKELRGKSKFPSVNVIKTDHPYSDQYMKQSSDALLKKRLEFAKQLADAWTSS